MSCRSLSRRAFVLVSAAFGISQLTGCSSTSKGDASSPIEDTAQDEAYTPNAEEEGSVEWVDVAPNERAYWDHMAPDPSEIEGTVREATVSPNRRQVLWLWEKGGEPGGPDRGYADESGFRPSVTCLPAQTQPVRGAVLLCAGGAFSIRGSYSDCFPTASELVQRGYTCFVVHYRLGQEVGAVDLARAVRFARAHAADYGYAPDAIAVMGYSAGAILAGEFLLHWDEDVSPTTYDASYTPDELDAIPARASAAGMIYGFYGRLSVSEKDPDVLRAGDLPPTFFCWGTRDPFAGRSSMNYSGGNQFELCASACEEAGIAVERHVLDGWGHGFGADGGWIDSYDKYLQGAFGAEV